MKRIRLLCVLLLCMMLLTGTSAFAAGPQPWLNTADAALQRALSEIGATKGQDGLLLLTNAGYGRVDGRSTEQFIDLGGKYSGCSIGSRNLMLIHGSILDPLWFSLYRKGSNKIVFAKWTGGGFEQQILDAAPDKILTPEGWKQAASGLIGPNTFSVVSYSLTWAVNPPWTLLLSSAFHDHFCPGVNAGYIAGQYVMDKLPLGPGDKYVFASAPGKCWADALQVMFNATPGKSSGYSMAISGKKLKEYGADGVNPMTVAMRVNQKKDSCTGVVLGFDWNKAYAATGVKADELYCKGGPSNPMFWVARVKMARALACMPREKLLGFMVALKSFSGPAKLAKQIGGGDPYQTVMK